jgi:hypothetical protein
MMRMVYVRAEPVAGDGPSAPAIVVAQHAHQALVPLRKDIDFSGYHLPPAEMVPYEAAPEEAQRILGEAAAHEIGVYGFRVLRLADPQDPNTPPAAVS